MEDYYEILGINPDSSLGEVKSAFRRQAKRHHPDLAAEGASDARNPGDSARTVVRVRETAMRLVLEAYRILSDAEKRRAYDRKLRKRRLEQGGFDYRRFLKERTLDPGSQAKLIVYDLLHDLEEEALEVYERSKSLGDFRLERWLDRGEAMDAEYCIAEEFEKRGRFLKAYMIYKRLIAMELQKPWFRYYYDVLALRFRTVVLQKLPGVLDEEDYLDRLDEAIELDVADRDSAQFLRKKAEVLIRRRDLEGAREAMDLAAALVPRLPGLAALRKRSAALK